MELVQYFIVNSELNMSADKIAAQVAHVATDIAIHMTTISLTYEGGVDNEQELKKALKFYEWCQNNQPKIILRGKLKQLEKMIDEYEDCFFIRDNGRTEVPKNSLTVVGFIPEYKSVMAPIAKRFQLL